jgi:transglutaminase-like putative cysteine protease
MGLILAGLNDAQGREAALYRFAPAAGWVKPGTVEYNAPPPASGTPNGSWGLFFDRQTNVTAEGEDLYHHSAVKVISSSGVDEQSQFNIEVDPTFESLDIHSLRVVREGRFIDLRRGSRITALPQETELRNRIYNGGYNINVLLPDVRIGDVIEYDYTIHARPKNFPGHFSARYTIGWSSPLHYQRIRILSPVSRGLTYRVNDGRPVPTPTVRAGVSELDWEWHDLAGIVAEEDRPRWYETWPYLQVSDLHDWGTVARLVTPLYTVNEPLSADLKEIIRTVRSAGGKPEEQALHVLQFVQEQIRYVSVSIGPGAFRPSSPNAVVARRYGDCKEKALLLAIMLRELGIEAQPALVNTRRGHLLGAALPTPYTFDHAILRAKIGASVYWLDGTDDKQFAPLSTDSPADFEHALVIDAATDSLETIPRPAPNASGKTSDVVIDMRRGPDKPAALLITTSYLGEWADSMRQDLADENPEQRASNYVNYIAEYYPGAKASGPITIQDDKSKNVVYVGESYDLAETFTKNERGRMEFFLQADELYGYASRLKSSVRKVPLAIKYPASIRQTVHVLLPQKWQISNDAVKIDNPAFRYRSDVSYSEPEGVPRLTLDYRYEALMDTVAVADLPKYLADRKRVYDDLGYALWLPTKYSFKVPSEQKWELQRIKPAPLPAALIVLTLLVGIRIALRWGYRFDPKPVAVLEDAPVGIRGWLWLFALVVLVTPLLTSVALYSWGHYIDVSRWPALYNSAPGPFKAWVQAGVLLIEMSRTLLLVGQGLLIWLFFTRRSSAPRVFVAMFWAAVALNLIATIFFDVSHLGSHITVYRLLGQFTANSLDVGAYTAYMLLSKRVKATFVQRLRSGNGELGVAAGTV